MNSLDSLIYENVRFIVNFDHSNNVTGSVNKCLITKFIYIFNENDRFIGWNISRPLKNGKFIKQFFPLIENRRVFKEIKCKIVRNQFEVSSLP